MQLTGDWDPFLGPLKWARAEAGADSKRTPRDYRVVLGHKNWQIETAA